MICNSSSQIRRALKILKLPLIIKPFTKTEKWNRYSPLDKAYKINSFKDFNSIKFNLFEAAPKLLVQQWIPGGDSNVFFCLVNYDKNSKLDGTFIGQKLLQSPPYFGSTAFAIGVKCYEIEDYYTTIV